MGHRLSKIYTRTGDQGTTGLCGKQRLLKDDIRIELIGEVDELNSAIGIIIADIHLNIEVKNILKRIQHELFNLGGELSLPEGNLITQQHVEHLEQDIDECNQRLEPLKEFILPGGHPSAAYCHLARAICRRAERRMVSFQKTDATHAQAYIYLNRLSDLLFVLARTINRLYQHPEVLWVR